MGPLDFYASWRKQQQQQAQAPQAPQAPETPTYDWGDIPLVNPWEPPPPPRSPFAPPLEGVFSAEQASAALQSDKSPFDWGDIGLSPEGRKAFEAASLRMLPALAGGLTNVPWISGTATGLGELAAQYHEGEGDWKERLANVNYPVVGMETVLGSVIPKPLRQGIGPMRGAATRAAQFGGLATIGATARPFLLGQEHDPLYMGMEMGAGTLLGLGGGAWEGYRGTSQAAKLAKERAGTVLLKPGGIGMAGTPGEVTATGLPMGQLPFEMEAPNAGAFTPESAFQVPHQSRMLAAAIPPRQIPQPRLPFHPLTRPGFPEPELPTQRMLPFGEEQPYLPMGDVQGQLPFDEMFDPMRAARPLAEMPPPTAPLGARNVPTPGQPRLDLRRDPLSGPALARPEPEVPTQPYFDFSEQGQLPFGEPRPPAPPGAPPVNVRPREGAPMTTDEMFARQSALVDDLIRDGAPANQIVDAQRTLEILRRAQLEETTRASRGLPPLQGRLNLGGIGGPRLTPGFEVPGQGLADNIAAMQRRPPIAPGSQAGPTGQMGLPLDMPPEFAVPNGPRQGQLPIEGIGGPRLTPGFDVPPQTPDPSMRLVPPRPPTQQDLPFGTGQRVPPPGTPEELARIQALRRGADLTARGLTPLDVVRGGVPPPRPTEIPTTPRDPGLSLERGGMLNIPGAGGFRGFGGPLKPMPRDIQASPLFNVTQDEIDAENLKWSTVAAERNLAARRAAAGAEPTQGQLPFEPTDPRPQGLGINASPYSTAVTSAVGGAVGSQIGETEEERQRNMMIGMGFISVPMRTKGFFSKLEDTLDAAVDQIRKGRKGLSLQVPVGAVKDVLRKFGQFQEGEWNFVGGPEYLAKFKPGDKVDLEELRAELKSRGIDIEETTLPHHDPAQGPQTGPRPSDPLVYHGPFTTWGQNLQLPGATQHREFIFRMPSRNPPEITALKDELTAIENQIDTIRQQINVRYGFAADDAWASLPSSAYTERDALLMPLLDQRTVKTAELQTLQRRYPPPYNTRHFENYGPDVVGWVRTSVREVNGKQYLNIDEFQTDKHQKALTQGYRKVGEDPSQLVLITLDDWLPTRGMSEAERAAFQALPWQERDTVVNQAVDELRARPVEERAAIMREWEAARRPNFEAQKSAYGIPRTDPFGYDELDIDLLSMRRMILLAIDENLDGVTWTTARQQNLRYSNLIENAIGIQQDGYGGYQAVLRDPISGSISHEALDDKHVRQAKVMLGKQWPAEWKLRPPNTEYDTAFEYEYQNIVGSHPRATPPTSGVSAPARQLSVPFIGKTVEIPTRGMAKAYDERMISIAQKILNPYGGKVTRMDVDVAPKVQVHYTGPPITPQFLDWVVASQGAISTRERGAAMALMDEVASTGKSPEDAITTLIERHRLYRKNVRDGLLDLVNYRGLGSVSDPVPNVYPTRPADISYTAWENFRREGDEAARLSLRADYEDAGTDPGQIPALVEWDLQKMHQSIAAQTPPPPGLEPMWVFEFPPKMREEIKAKIPTGRVFPFGGLPPLGPAAQIAAQGAAGYGAGQLMGGTPEEREERSRGLAMASLGVPLRGTALKNFYSRLTKAVVERFPAGKMRASAVLGTLNRVAQQGEGFSNEELVLSGLPKKLAAMGNEPITKDELVAYVRENELTLRVKRLPQRHPETGAMEQNVVFNPGGSDPFRLGESMVLPGGTNQFEHLYEYVPRANPEAAARRAEIDTRIRAIEDGIWERGPEERRAGRNEIERLRVQQEQIDPQTPYIEHHYEMAGIPDPGTIMHARGNDRLVNGGIPARQMEESQSTIHNLAKKKGYRIVPTSETAEGYRLASVKADLKVQEELGQLRSELDLPPDAGFEDIVTKAGYGRRDDLVPRLEGVRSLLKEIDTLGQRSIGAYGVPDVPFKGKAGKGMSAEGFTLKAQILEAARDGRKMLTWTTGETQTTRSNAYQAGATRLVRTPAFTPDHPTGYQMQITMQGRGTGGLRPDDQVDVADQLGDLWTPGHPAWDQQGRSPEGFITESLDLTQHPLRTKPGGMRLNYDQLTASEADRIIKQYPTMKRSMVTDDATGETLHAIEWDDDFVRRVQADEPLFYMGGAAAPGMELAAAGAGAAAQAGESDTEQDRWRKIALGTVAVLGSGMAARAYVKRGKWRSASPTANIARLNALDAAREAAEQARLNRPKPLTRLQKATEAVMDERIAFDIYERQRVEQISRRLNQKVALAIEDDPAKLFDVNVGGQGGRVRNIATRFRRITEKALSQGLDGYLRQYLDLKGMGHGLNTLQEKAGDAFARAAATNDPAEQAKHLKTYRDLLEDIANGETMPQGYTPEHVAQDEADFRAQVGDKFDAIDDLGKQVLSMNREVLDLIHAEGFIDDALYQKLTARGMSYVPMTRIMDTVMKANFRGRVAHLSAPQQQVIMDLWGSKRDTMNPILASALRYQEAVREVGANEAAREFVKLREYAPEFAADIRPLRTPGQLPGVPSQQLRPGEGLIHVYHGGERIPYAVPEHLAVIMQNANARDVQTVSKLFRLPAKILRGSATTFNVPFAMWNVPRDIRDTRRLHPDFKPYNVKDLGQHLNEWRQNFLSAMREDANHAEFLDSRAGLAGMTSNLIDPETFLDIRPLSQLPIHKRLYRTAVKVSQALEETPKMVAYNRSIKAGRSQVEAAYLARTLAGTPDLAVKGVYGNQLNTALMFFNAGLQGVRRNIQHGVTNPKKFATAMAGATLMSLALDRWNRQEKLRDSDGVLAIDKVPELTRRTSFAIAIPHTYVDNDGTVRNYVITLLPKGHFDQMLYTPIESAIAALRGEKPAAQVGIDIANVMTPGNMQIDTKGDPAEQDLLRGVAAMANPLPGTIVEQLMNRQTAFDVPIIPQRLAQHPASEQVEPTTSPSVQWMSEQLGKSPIWPLGMDSPLRLQAALRRSGIGIGPGEMLQSGIDAVMRGAGGTPDTRLPAVGPAVGSQFPVLGPIARRLVAPTFDQQQRNIEERFYQMLEQTEATKRKVDTYAATRPREDVMKLMEDPAVRMQYGLSDVLSAFAQELGEIRATRRILTMRHQLTPEKLKQLLQAERQTLERIDQRLTPMMEKPERYLPPQGPPSTPSR